MYTHGKPLFIFSSQAQTAAYVKYFGQSTSEQFPEDIAEVFSHIRNYPPNNSLFLHNFLYLAECVQSSGLMCIILAADTAPVSIQGKPTF